MSSIQIQYS